ncbi:MAG: hypothetical protein B6D55_02445 [Candidatus Omnitrophica bacterium 4484_70.2]|nr:MAG: hypothetical protein B6D55_02445 [Candidatus Omnitrophica bacterium 4484_70.2]
MKVTVLKKITDLVGEDVDFRIPYSELALATGTAGANILTISILSKRWVRIRYYKFDEKTLTAKSGEIEGLPTELIPIETINKYPILKEEFDLESKPDHLK